MSKLLVGILFASTLFVATEAVAKNNKACMDRCFKQYSKCHQPRTGKNICQTQKAQCERSCR